MAISEFRRCGFAADALGRPHVSLTDDFAWTKGSHTIQLDANVRIIDN